MIKYLNLLVVLSFFGIVPLRAQQTSSTASSAANSGSSIATVLSPSSGLREGYVIITPTSGSGSGLVAYEKVGDLQGLTFQTAVLPATTLTTSGAVIVDLNTGENSLTGPLSTLLGNNPNATAAAGAILPMFVNTGISVINPNLTSATIRLSLNNSSGTKIDLPGFTIGPMQQVAKFASELFGSPADIPPSLVGALVFTSDIPVGITALEFRGTAFSTIPVVNTSTTSTASKSSSGSGGLGLPAIIPFPPLPTGVGGSGSLLLPQFVMGGGWASGIVIANVSNIQQTVRVDFFTSNGFPLSAFLGLLTGSTFSSITIPAGGAVDLSPQDAITGQTIF
ncbi:MAG TPA: hypothetical protein VGK48_25670 [Terriglobia bacterium]|jgi:hypothetical protein